MSHPTHSLQEGHDTQGKEVQIYRGEGKDDTSTPGDSSKEATNEVNTPICPQFFVMLIFVRR
jgi:hypothetical protein